MSTGSGVNRISDGGGDSRYSGGGGGGGGNCGGGCGCGGGGNCMCVWLLIQGTRDETYSEHTDSDSLVPPQMDPTHFLAAGLVFSDTNVRE